MSENWDRRFMELARLLASWSKDDTKVGCVIVDAHNIIRSTGYNGLVRKSNDNSSERRRRPIKYMWTEHAERNAIYNAAMTGVSLVGCRMYLPWFPCMDCARAIVQSGIHEVIALHPDFGDEKWGAHFTMAAELLSETGVLVRYYSALQEAKDVDDSP